MSGVVPQPSRVGMVTDPERRCVALVIQGTEFVYSAGVANLAPSLGQLRAIATSARLAETTLRQAHAELAANWLGEALVRAGSNQRCSLCERGAHRFGGACTWCGNPA